MEDQHPTSDDAPCENPQSQWGDQWVHPEFDASTELRNPRPGDRNPAVTLFDTNVPDATVVVFPAISPIDHTQVYLFREVGARATCWVRPGQAPQPLAVDFEPTWIWSLSIGPMAYDFPSQRDVERALDVADQAIARREGWVTAARTGRLHEPPTSTPERIPDPTVRAALPTALLKALSSTYHTLDVAAERRGYGEPLPPDPIATARACARLAVLVTSPEQKFERWVPDVEDDTILHLTVPRMAAEDYPDDCSVTGGSDRACIDHLHRGGLGDNAWELLIDQLLAR